MNADSGAQQGRMANDLGEALQKHAPSIWMVVLFTTFVNFLMLTGPLFMLQVYDRVLPSRSAPTLVALTVLLIALFAAMAILDIVRGKIGSRMGAQLQSDLDERVFQASLSAQSSVSREASTALFDLEAVRRFAASQTAFAMLDLPFSPLFAGGIFLLHPYLGSLALIGGAMLVCIAILNQMLSRRPSESASQPVSASIRISEQIRAQSETVRALGMTDVATWRWKRERDLALASEIRLSDLNGGFASALKALRLLLQSGMLALGAWLVIHDEATGGVMIASSILMGRALAPIEQVVGGWAPLVRAIRGWSSLNHLLASAPVRAPKTELPRPQAHLSVANLTIVPPGEDKATLQRISFSLGPGQAIGVVGESASGKSSLARALVGLWPPFFGEVCLSGARLGQYDETTLSAHIGYLPQEVALFEGTVAQNIARWADRPNAAEVVKAARLSGAHAMILGLPQGYDTPVGAGHTKLSGGQKQRIGLARALFGDPVMVVLDEPNSNLDAPGTENLNAAVRRLKADGRIVIIMAHRPTAIAECDLILMLRNRQVAAFGPRDAILSEIAASSQTTAASGQRQAGSAK